MNSTKIHPAFSSMKSPAGPMAPELRRAGDLKVRGLEEKQRRPATTIESAVINLLAREHELPWEELVTFVADFLYHEEIHAGASTVDVVLFSSRLFVPEARNILNAGNGELCNIADATN